MISPVRKQDSTSFMLMSLSCIHSKQCFAHFKKNNSQRHYRYEKCGRSILISCYQKGTQKGNKPSLIHSLIVQNPLKTGVLISQNISSAGRQKLSHGEPRPLPSHERCHELHPGLQLLHVLRDQTCLRSLRSRLPHASPGSSSCCP